MKLKEAILFVLLITPVILYSQIEIISKSSLKKVQLPEKRTKMFELNFSPFSPTAVISFDNFQTKYWLNKKTVLRLGLQLKNLENSTKDGDYDPAEQHKTNKNEKTLLVGIKPGIEFRFLQNSKISPYIGFEQLYQNKSTSADYKEYVQYFDYTNGQSVLKYDFVETKVDGAWRDLTTVTNINPNGTTYKYASTDYTGERAFSNWGGNLLAGSDFYFVQNMYIGFEVGLGYESKKIQTSDIQYFCQLHQHKYSFLHDKEHRILL
ncbi:MAG: hypothetical protein PHV20_02520 [Bacteroidales bacterium]|nr:hypothetical protein [Bacteroidales bacterium]